MQTNFKKNIGGYTLPEMVVYVAIMSITCFIIANTFVSFILSYREIKALSLVDRSAIDVMERMTRDIRGATSVDVVNSTFGSNPGVLTLISTANGVSTTTKFYVVVNASTTSYIGDNVINVDLNGSYYGPLTQINTSVTSVVFNRIVTPISEAIKVDLVIAAYMDNTTESKTYHSTIVLRGQ